MASEKVRVDVDWTGRKKFVAHALICVIATISMEGWNQGHGMRCTLACVLDNFEVSVAIAE